SLLAAFIFRVFTQQGLMDFWLLLLLSLLVEVDISFPYNVEVQEYSRFSAAVGGLFGYRVVQFNSTIGERVLIGDPGSNMLHTCDVVSGTCENLTLPDRGNASHLGLTLEVEPVSRRCLVCGFAEPHDCSQTLYTNGACYTVDSGLTASEMRTPGYQVLDLDVLSGMDALPVSSCVLTYRLSSSLSACVFLCPHLLPVFFSLSLLCLPLSSPTACLLLSQPVSSSVLTYCLSSSLLACPVSSSVLTYRLSSLLACVFLC
ncbi:unnamed protein product, partial [Ranitomeya imitator]